MFYPNTGVVLPKKVMISKKSTRRGATNSKNINRRWKFGKKNKWWVKTEIVSFRVCV